MCPADDAHLTLEFDDHYVIQPTITFAGRPDYAPNRARRRRARRSAQGFEYHSGSNPHFLSVERDRRRSTRHATAADDSLRPPGHQRRRHRRGRGGPALGLPHAGPGRRRASSRRSPRCAARRTRVAVNNATAALHIACLALGVGPGDRLWTAPITFVASPTARAIAAPTSISSTSTRHLQHVSVAALAAQAGAGAAAGPPAEGRRPGAFRRPALRHGARSARWRDATASGSSRTPRMRSAPRYRGEHGRQLPLSATSRSSASIRSRSSPPAKAAWR